MQFRPISSAMLARAAFTSLALLSACKSRSAQSDLPHCPAGAMPTGWTRRSTQFGNASILVPPDAQGRVLPHDGGSTGEAWGSQHWDLYYRFDSTRTIRSIERGPLVQDWLQCADTVSGYPGTFVTLYSTGTATPGMFGQATWTLPNGRSFYVAVLTANQVSKDTVLGILRSVRFKKP